jgi:1-acyl-sn-glycerol-3-phosphate acyltransferase
MTARELNEHFLNHDAYSSPSPTTIEGPMLTKTVLFYSRILSIIARTSARAMTNRLDPDDVLRKSIKLYLTAERCGGEVHVDGLDHLKALDAPVVFVGNHMSAYETLFMQCFILPFSPVTFVLKASLLKYPFFGGILRKLDPIAVERKNPREDLKLVLKEGEHRLRNGHSVIIFPQSTRSPVFEPREFNSLGVKLAKKADVRIVPIALKTDLWANGQRIKDFGVIDLSKPCRISFGPALDISDNPKATHQAVIDFIQGKLDSWS